MADQYEKLVIKENGVAKINLTAEEIAEGVVKANSMPEAASVTTAVSKINSISVTAEEIDNAAEKIDSMPEATEINAAIAATKDTTLKNSVDTLSTQVTNLGGRFTNIENDVRALQNNTSKTLCIYYEEISKEDK